MIVYGVSFFRFLFFLFSQLNDLYYLLKDHRQHFNRIIHEFLIGEANAQFSRTQMKDYE